MKYVVCLKNFTGEGQEISGEIKFYQFVFDINNMMDFLTLSTGKKSLELFQLPAGLRGGIDVNREVEMDILQPYSSEETVDGEEEDEDQQELTSWWVENYDEIYDRVAREVGYSDPGHKESFKRFLQPNGIPGSGGTRQDGKPSPTGWQSRTAAWALQEFPQDISEKKSPAAAIKKTPQYLVAYYTYQSMRRTYTKLANEYRARKRELKKQVKGGSLWASTDQSIAYLRELQKSSPEGYAQALLKTRGYAGRIQWIVNKNQIETATQALGQRAYIGRLFIGVQHVAEMVDMYRGMVNDNIFEIIRDLKSLVFYCNKFFSEGLQKENAEKVIESSQSINDKTKTVISQQAEPSEES